LEGFTPSEHKNEMTACAQQWCNPKVEATCLYYECTSFTDHNCYSTTCLDLGQYVVCMMSTRAQSGILPGIYMKRAHTFLIHFVCEIL